MRRTTHETSEPPTPSLHALATEAIHTMLGDDGYRQFLRGRLVELLWEDNVDSDLINFYESELIKL